MSEDFVPGVSDADLTVSHDSANVPFGDNADIEDVEIDLGMLPTDKAEDIERGTFRQIPIGDHVVMVLKVEFAGGKYGDDEDVQRLPKQSKVYLAQPDGTVRPAEYWSRQVRVTYCLPGDVNCTISDFFALPPTDPTEREAYEHGFGSEDEAEAFASGKSKKAGGFNAKRLVYFLARLGFMQDANGKLPAEASRLKNWVYYPGTDKHRLIGITVAGGRTDPKNPSKKVYNNIQLFTHRYIPPPDGIHAPSPPAHIAAPEPNGKGKATPPVKPGKRSTHV